MDTSKKLIIFKATRFAKDMIIGYDDYDSTHAYLNDRVLSDKLNDLSLTDLGDGFYNVDQPFIAVEFIIDVVSNRRLHHDESATDFLIGSFYPKYSSCSLGKLFKDISDKFDVDHISKYGSETIQFIGEFEMWSYYDSWCGDGDAGIDYVKIWDESCFG